MTTTVARVIHAPVDCAGCGARITGNVAWIDYIPYHEECFERALHRVFGGRGTPADWAARCPDVTPDHGNGRVMRKPTP